MMPTSNKANAILLAVLVLASVLLALAGFEVGLFVLLMVAGMALRTTLVHFATRSRHARKPVALLLLLGLLALPVAAMTVDIEWLVFVPGISELPYGPLFFGLVAGVARVAFGRLVGRGAWAGD